MAVHQMVENWITLPSGTKPRNLSCVSLDKAMIQCLINADKQIQVLFVTRSFTMVLKVVIRLSLEGVMVEVVVWYS